MHCFSRNFWLAIVSLCFLRALNWGKRTVNKKSPLVKGQGEMSQGMRLCGRDASEKRQMKTKTLRVLMKLAA